MKLFWWKRCANADLGDKNFGRLPCRPLVQALEQNCCQKNVKKLPLDTIPGRQQDTADMVHHHFGPSFCQLKTTKFDFFEKHLTSFLHLPSNYTEGNGLKKHFFLFVGFISKNTRFSQ